MRITMYGIRNCDTIRKARAWLDARGVAYDFHDYKVSGIDRARLERWRGEIGWARLINRAGTTFRQLPDATKATLDETRALALMLEQPSLIKRPVLDVDGHVTVGFSAEVYDRITTSR